MIHSHDLNIRHLFAIITVARLSSISRAAEDIHISQPALTHALHKLETQLDHKLFERRHLGMEVTPQGRLFLDHAHDGIMRIAAAAQQIRQSFKLSPLVAPERHITSTQLRAFLAVLQTGSYTLAAKALNFSQPSVYRAVRELQIFLGVPLFYVSASVLRTTEPVQQFGAQIKLAMVDIQSGIDGLAAMHEPGVGRIAVGSLALARSALLPALLVRFSSIYPKASITVAEGQYEELLGGLRNGSIDMIFGALRVDLAFLDLEQRTLFYDGLFVIGRAGHPLTKQPVSVEQLSTYPWIVAAKQSPMRIVWEKFFSDAGVALPAQTVESSSILLARGLMCNGDWLGLMSAHQSELEEQYGVLARISGVVPESTRPIGLTIRQDWRPTAMQQQFLNMAQEMAVPLSIKADSSASAPA